MIPSLNTREVVALLSTPPYSLNRPGTAQVYAIDNENICLEGAGEYVQDIANLLLDKKSKWRQQFSKKRITFQQTEEMMEDVSYKINLKVNWR